MVFALHIELDYKHGDNVWNDFDIKNLGDYHDLYIQDNTLFLTVIYDDFRDSCLKTKSIGPAHIYSTLRLALVGVLKMTKVFI